MQFERGVSFLPWGLGALIALAFAIIVHAVALRKMRNLKLTHVA